MKILKYGYGGVYTPYRSGKGTTSSDQTSSGSSNKNNTPLKDNLLSLLKENALPNDHRGTLELAMHVLSKYDNIPGIDISSAEYITLLNAINDGKVNQDTWKKASDYIYANDTAEEVAIDSYGNMFVGKVEEDGNVSFKKVKPEEYKTATEEGWRALSNAGLLTERANNDQLRWDMGVISGINSSTNASKISKKIQDAINALPETQEGYMLNKQGKLQEILHGAQYAMAEGDASNYYYESKSDAPKAIEEFYNYAWNFILSEKDKAYLRATLAHRGGDPMDAASCFNIITNGLNLYTHKDFQIREDKTSGSSGGRSGSGGSSEAMIQGTLAETYSTGDSAGLPEELYIAPSGSGVRLKVIGQSVGPFVDKEEKTRFGRANVQAIFENAYAVGRQMMNTHTVMFGDQLIRADQISGIMYDDSNLYQVHLPAIKLDSGDIVPDFQLLEKAEELKTQIANKNLSADIINRYVQALCPGAIYDEQTKEIKFPPERTQLFITFEGLAGTRFVDFNPNSKFLHLDGETGREHLNLYEPAIKYGLTNPGKNPTKRNDAPDSLGFLKRNKLYKGNVFIPISITAGSMNYNPGYMPKASHDNITGRVAEMEREKQVDFYSQQREYSW